MANTIPAVMTQLLARSVEVLRRRTHMARLVTTEYSLVPGRKGKTVDIELPPTKTAAAVTPAPTPPSDTDMAATTVAITLDKWYASDFHMDDQQQTQVLKDQQFYPPAAAASLNAVIEQVDDDLLGLHTDVYNAGGTAATTPFATTSVAWTTGARKHLNREKAPMADRSVVLNSDAEANAVNLSAFQDLSQSGDQSVIVEGEIGRKLGALWHLNQGVPDFTGGTLSNGSAKAALVNDASYTVGESTVDIDASSLSGTVVKGDIFTVAGDTQQYVVTAGQTASGNAIAAMAFAPTSKVAWADNAVITFVADHAANLSFQRGAFALATAPFESGMGTTQSIVDPLSGLVIRLEVSRQHKQDKWEFDVLYGVKTLRAELAAKILG